MLSLPIDSLRLLNERIIPNALTESSSDVEEVPLRAAFERRQSHLPKTKNGEPQTISLNSVALVALDESASRGQDNEINPGLPFRAERIATRFTWLVSQRARRGED